MKQTEVTIHKTQPPGVRYTSQ